MASLTQLSAQSILSQLNPDDQQNLFETQIKNLDKQGKEKLLDYLKWELYRGVNSLSPPDYVIFDVGYTDRLLDDNNDKLSLFWSLLGDYGCDATFLYVGPSNSEGSFEVYRPPKEDDDEDSWPPFSIHPEAKKIHQAIVESQGEMILWASILVKIEDHCAFSDFGAALSECEHCRLFPNNPRELEFMIIVDGEPKMVRKIIYDRESG